MKNISFYFVYVASNDIKTTSNVNRKSIHWALDWQNSRMQIYEQPTSSTVSTTDPEISKNDDWISSTETRKTEGE